MQAEHSQRDSDVATAKKIEHKENVNVPRGRGMHRSIRFRASLLKRSHTVLVSVSTFLFVCGHRWHPADINSSLYCSQIPI